MSKQRAVKEERYSDKHYREVQDKFFSEFSAMKINKRQKAATIDLLYAYSQLLGVLRAVNEFIQEKEKEIKHKRR